MAEAGLARVAIAGRYGLSEALNRTEASATPLQDWAATAPLDASGPHLTFLEDLTGSGKTEAALILAHRLMAQGNASGLYWALPTQATANALYGRLSISYRKLFEDASAQPSLALAHGSVDLHEEFNRSLFRPAMDETAGAPEKPYGTGEEQETASALCAQWLASDRRRSLLADVGAGTVDQALLAALPVKFQSLRLTALSEHVLIVDAAHSYDKYTTRLLKQALLFQAVLMPHDFIFNRDWYERFDKEEELFAYQAELVKLDSSEQGELLSLLSSCHPREFVGLARLATPQKTKNILRFYVPLPKARLFEIWAKQKELIQKFSASVPPDDELVEDVGLQADDELIPMPARAKRRQRVAA